MSNLIELLTNTNLDIKDSSKIKSSENFIIKLLEELDPQKAVKLLKNLDLSDEQIQKTIHKLPKNTQQSYSNFLQEIKNTKEVNLEELTKNLTGTGNENFENKIINLLLNNKNPNPEIKNKIKHIKHEITEIIKLSNQDFLKSDTKEVNLEATIENDNLDKNNDNLDKNYEKKHSTKNENNINNFENKIINLLLNNKNPNPEIKNKIKHIKHEITEIIKKEITALNKKENNLFNHKIITRIKNTSNFEELITVANKNGLNIKKIVTKIIKQQTEPKTSQILPKPKINPKHLKKIQTNTKKQEITPIKIKNSTHNSIINSLLSNDKKINMENVNNLNNETKTLTNENNDNKENNLIKTDITTAQINHKIIKAKESIKHFSTNLKEAIENYKPPVSKLSIELHPKELGKVEVTIIHRGDNLQININSNNQAINFFHTHQNELKNALVNMGYSGIDMSFNSNQNKEQKKAFKQYSSNQKNEEYDELIIEIPYTYA